MSASEPGAATSVIQVLLCGSLARIGLDPEPAARWIEENIPDVRVDTVPDLCNKPGAISAALDERARGIVLGLCSSRYSEPEVQRQARRSGIDPLAIAAVNLGGLHSAAVAPDTQNNDRAIRLLAAAIARISAFSGSTAEGIRPQIMGERQKVSRRALFTMPPIIYRPVVSIDRNQCAADRGCQQCVDACPAEALSSVNGKIEVARRSCVSCGVCQSVCPTSAARLPGSAHRQEEAEVSELLADTDLPESRPRGILYVCRESAAAIDRMADASVPLASHWLPVIVPCSGYVSPAMLLQALAHGARATGILGCASECHHDQQPRSQGRVEYCQDFLTSIGASSRAVRFFDATAGVLELGAELNSSLPDALETDRSGLREISFEGPAAIAAAVRAIAGTKVPASDMTPSNSPLGSVSVRVEGCTGCGSCAQACPTAALNLSERDGRATLSYDPNYCTGCGQCAVVCPEQVITVADSTSPAALVAGRVALYEDTVVKCESCGAPVAPRAMLKRIRAVLDDDERPTGAEAMRAITRLCTSCRGIGSRQQKFD